MIKLRRNNTFDIPILLINGHCSCGKEKVSRLLEHYEGVEKSKEDELFYCICLLHHLNKISTDTTIALIRTLRDKIMYYEMVGRCINFRFYDVTSLFKHPNPYKYIKRAFSTDEHDIINNKIFNEKPILQNMLSNSLCMYDMLKEAFGDNIKFIHVLRNPASVIYTMYKRGYGSREGVDPMTTDLSYVYNNTTLPVYAIGWEDEYISATPLDRIIHMIHDFQYDDIYKYERLNDNDRKHILLIEFEKFINNPSIYYNKIEEFISRKPNETIKDFYTYPESDEEIKKCVEFIEKNASRLHLDMFHQTMNDYNQFKKRWVDDA